jgi:hypothetical protein
MRGQKIRSPVRVVHLLGMHIRPDTWSLTYHNALSIVRLGVFLRQLVSAVGFAELCCGRSINTMVMNESVACVVFKRRRL